MRTTGLFLLLAAAPLAAAPHWQLRYFYDSDTASLVLTDLAFPTPARGFAAGYLAEARKTRPTAVVTADGGRTWTQVRLPELPESIFFLNDRLGWMAAKNSVWQTPDFGQSWKKLSKLSGVLRVHFQDENRGWAVGIKKAVYETTDGGRHWTRLAAADQPATPKDLTVYDCIAFATPELGLIAGYSESHPVRPERLPDWMQPNQRRREPAGTTLLLQTHNGGRTWTHAQTPTFGQVTRISIRPDGQGLALIEFFHAFEWPSEVLELDWRTGKSTQVFRRKDLVVTDVALPASGPGYLAAVQPEGQLPRSPVPGKLRILSSDNLLNWKEMPVDYRAVARRAVLAGAGPGKLWLATDTGMLLELAE